MRLKNKITMRIRIDKRALTPDELVLLATLPKKKREILERAFEGRLVITVG